MIGHISSSGDLRYVVVKHYFGELNCIGLPDLLSASDLDTSVCHRWPQALPFKRRGVRKRKNCSPLLCPFCVCISFDRILGNYVIKNCVLAYEGHIVNKVYIFSHEKFESNLAEEE